VRVYRFINPQAENIRDIQPRKRLSREEYAELLREPLALGRTIGAHEAGATDDSPLVSVTVDHRAAAATTDDSQGGLRGIVDYAPNLAVFDVPRDFLLQARGENLQGREGEAVVLLPPDKSLSDYFVELGPNPYLKKKK
jgi:hypothetical protein